jgi:hypothetical protein
MKLMAVVAAFGFGCGGAQQRKTGQADAPDDRPPATSQTAGPGTAKAADTGDLSDACKRSDVFGPFELTGEQALRRRGLGDRLFSDTASSADAPIEVCGPYGELTWLLRMTCADGSKPWGKDERKAHAARSGSQPGKGRCGSSGPMIDLYEAPCPEKRYAIYMDMYECGPGEDMMRGI